MWEQRTKQNVSSLVPDWTLIELGGAYLRAGKYDEAKELVVPALKSLERTSQDADKVGTLMESLRILADVSIAQENGAAALRYLKDYEATKALHQQLLKVAMKRERANAPEVGRTFSEFDRAWTESVNYAERASTASSFGKAYSLTGQHLEAATKFLDAVEIIENLRGFLGFEDRLNFFGKYTSPYHLLVDSLLRLDGKDQGLVLKRFPGKGRSSAEIAFYFAESARARLLSERIARSSAGGLGGKISPEILRIEREHLNTATAELRGGIPFQESPAYRRFQSFIEDIRKTYPDYTTLKYPAPVTSSEVPLREKETLLVYAVLRQSVAVWLLQRAKEPRVFQIPVAQDRLLKTISAIRASLEPQSDKRLPPFDFRASGELYQWLLAEPLKSVSRGSTIIVIPDSALGTIPFEALSVRRRDGTIEFMGEHYTFSYTPSATVLTYKRKISSPARTPIRGVRILAVGDPVYEEADPRLAKSPPVNETMLRARRAALRAYWRNRGFSRLPGTNQRSKP
jgi:tetratricopeptide (TPR) repeat protein